MPRPRGEPRPEDDVGGYHDGGRRHDHHRQHRDYDERDYEEIYYHFDDVARHVIDANDSNFVFSLPEQGAGKIFLLFLNVRR